MKSVYFIFSRNTYTFNAIQSIVKILMGHYCYFLFNYFLKVLNFSLNCIIHNDFKKKFSFTG